MQFEYDKLLKSCYRLILTAVTEDWKVKRFQDSLRQIVNNYPVLLRSERLAIYYRVSDLFTQVKHHIEDGKWRDILARDTRYDLLVSACRRAAACVDSRIKLDSLYKAMEDGYIFFLASAHDNCGDDHKDLQGKLYVNRFWRNYVKPELYKDVLGYIKNRGVKTVQSVLFKPHWFTTRPFCKHWFLAVDSITVLKTSQNLLRQRYLKKLRPIYSDYDYGVLKQEIFKMLQSIYPCKEFKRKLKERP